MPKKRSAGRPPKIRGRKDAQVIFLVEQAKKERYERAAEIAQCDDLSKWIRQVLDEAADKLIGDR